MSEFIITLSYIGLLLGASRCLPQTWLTIKSKNVNNISVIYFICHFFAGWCGLIYEIQVAAYSIAHVLFFIMIIITNAVQIIYVIIYRYT
ncbi:Uncharacterised protein [Legionella busanensis]|uniref:PQ loop repeat n=1 Tax=Legionella busanensis TaxID=190655 RepID=A0A378JKZ6_9GAMM|nr:PQ-loop domain-containing transporter [Legionella busanensis]STX50993.1 Uncharacterised protein [Legionella busanensis]